MRFKLTLAVDKRLHILPINYQYEIASWIYRTIHYGNSSFAKYLHEKGYRLENKQFKLFTFSQIFIPPRWERLGDRLKIYSPTVSIQISFYIKEAIQHFVIGLFQHQRFDIGDKKSCARFTVQTVETLPDPDFGNEAAFRCLSPICLSRTVETKKQPEYLAPDDVDYASYFFDNLLYKYMAATGSERSFDQLKARMNKQQPMLLEVLGEPKSRLVKIKADTPEETRVRGYFYQFKVIAPATLIEFGYHAGFGEKNSMGFGCVGVLSSGVE